MKITVVADADGRIVGFAHDAPGNGGAVSHATALAAGEGQTVHSVELPPELVQRVGDESFAAELFRHVVAKKGRVVSLVRAGAKGKAKAATKRR
jgi:hypothetical protein